MYIYKGCLKDLDTTIDQIIYKAREINSEFSGLIDFSCWKIGREYCHPTNPNWEKCPLKKCNHALNRKEQ